MIYNISLRARTVRISFSTIKCVLSIWLRQKLRKTTCSFATLCLIRLWCVWWCRWARVLFTRLEWNNKFQTKTNDRLCKFLKNVKLRCSGVKWPETTARHIKTNEMHFAPNKIEKQFGKQVFVPGRNSNHFVSIRMGCLAKLQQTTTNPNNPLQKNAFRMSVHKVCKLTAAECHQVAVIAPNTLDMDEHKHIFSSKPFEYSPRHCYWYGKAVHFLHQYAPPDSVAAQTFSFRIFVISAVTV